MLSILKPYKKFIVLFLALSSVIFVGIYMLQKPKKMLPIYAPRDVNPELVDSTIQHIGTDHKVSDFRFTNQNGKIITEKDYENIIYVADFFFWLKPLVFDARLSFLIFLRYGC